MVTTISLLTYPTVLCFLASITSTLFSSPASASCTSFYPLWYGVNNYNYSYPEQAATVYRVSETLNCSGPAVGAAIDHGCNATQCLLPMSDWLLLVVNSELNLNVSEAEKSDILALVKTSTPDIADANDLYFNASQTVTSGYPLAVCIPEDSTYYWGLFPTLICVDGYLGGCNGTLTGLSGTKIKAYGLNLGWGRTDSGFLVLDYFLDAVATIGPSRPGPENTTVGYDPGSIATAAKNEAGSTFREQWWWWFIVVSMAALSCLMV